MSGAPEVATAAVAFHVAEAVLQSVTRAFGDPHGHLDAARVRLRQARLPHADLDALCRAAKRAVRALENAHTRADRPACATFHAVAAAREALVVHLHAVRGAPPGASDHVARCKGASASALWNLTDGGPGSGHAAHGAVDALWQERPAGAGRAE